MNILRRDLGPAKGQNTNSPLLDCLALERDGKACLQAYFVPGFAAGQIEQANLPGPVDIRGIGGSLVVTFPRFGDGPVDLPLRDEKPLTLAPNTPEPELFAGLNCALVERNGESVQTVCDWLDRHAEQHGLQGALIVDRGKPGQSDRFAKSLEKQLDRNTAQGADLRLVVLSSPVPLGKPDTGPESHPINAPDAPGKDRMTPPRPDAWTAPLGAQGLYEILRWRFLTQARAVMNINMQDILVRDKDSVFDRAVAAPQGLVKLAGTRAYPWSLRKGKPARFGDHICVPFDASGGHDRWCVAPDKTPKDVTWRMTRLTGATPAPTTVKFFRCMALRHQADGKEAHKVSKIVPKSSLVEDAALLQLADALGTKPARMPQEARENPANARVAIVTCMKNEGPFILEWLAYHRAIGVDDFLVYSNDCDDGTDTMLDLLQSRGLLQHRDNPFRDSGLKPNMPPLRRPTPRRWSKTQAG